MIDDITPPELRQRGKLKIEPLPKPEQKPVHELAANEGWDLSEAHQSDDGIETVSLGEPVVQHHDAPKEKRQFSFHIVWNKKQKIIAGVIAVVVAFGIGAGWTLTHHKRAVVASTPPKKAAPKPVAATIYSDLSGLPVADAGVNKRTVVGVMIENSLDARPQSGLSQAGIVFEAVAEGGVTRFLALYQDQQPTNIGPVRSARPYYVQWAMGFNAAYAHVGGSPDALSDITSWNVRDLNQFYNGAAYHRISSRASPHNVYSGIDVLSQLAGSKGYTSSTYTALSRKKDAPSKTPNATSIDFKLSGPTYDPHYDYDAQTNSYKRSEAGEAHTDANTGAQLSPKVVIAIAVPLSQGALDASGAYYSNYNVIGTGEAWIFQDGTVTQANWSKTDNGSSLSFTNSDGKPIALNRGQTWISAVTDSSKVIYN